MTEKEKKRGKRNLQPDLDEIASASEYTGALPAQREENLPDEANEPDQDP